MNKLDYVGSINDFEEAVKRIEEERERLIDDLEFYDDYEDSITFAPRHMSSTSGEIKGLNFALMVLDRLEKEDEDEE